MGFGIGVRAVRDVLLVRLPARLRCPVAMAGLDPETILYRAHASRRVEVERIARGMALLDGMRRAARRSA